MGSETSSSGRPARVVNRSVVVPATWRDSRMVAASLISAAKRAGLEPSVVQRVNGGYRVPAAVAVRLGKPDTPVAKPSPTTPPVKPASKPSPKPVAKPVAKPAAHRVDTPSPVAPAAPAPTTQVDPGQLTDKQGAILASLRADPDVSLREHARRTGTAAKTVAEVRNKYAPELVGVGNAS